MFFNIIYVYFYGIVRLAFLIIRGNYSSGEGLEITYTLKKFEAII